MQERVPDDKLVVFEERSLIDQEQRETIKIEDRKDERGHSTGRRGTSAGHSAKFNQDKSVDRDSARGRENESHLESWERCGKNKEHDIKYSKEGRDRSSMGNRKRREETVQKRKPHQNESPNRCDKKKPKKQDKEERKTKHQRSGNIWEGGITVKPQKKISININLDGKRKEENFEKHEFPSENPQTEVELTVDGRELNRKDEVVQVTVKSKSDGDEENQIKPEEEETKASWEKAATGDDKVGTWTKVAGEEEHVVEKKKDREEEAFDLWHCALRGDDEKEEIKEQEEGDVMKGSRGHELVEGRLTGEDDSEQDIGQVDRKAERGTSRNRDEELMRREEMIRIEDVVRSKTERSSDGRQKSNMDNDRSGQKQQLTSNCECNYLFN